MKSSVRKPRIFCAALLCVATFVRADLVTINNLTKSDLWIATYYEGKAVERIGKPVLLQKQSSVVVERPKRKLWHNRELVFDYKKTILAVQLDEQRWSDVWHKNIGYTNGDTYFIVNDSGILRAYTNIEWNYLEPIKQAFSECYGLVVEPILDTIKKDHPAVVNNPYKDHIAHVRIGNNLHPGESAFLEKRRPKVKVALEKLLGDDVPDDQVPTIAFLMSGGGYRALISTVGTMLAADRTGLLDTTMYVGGLSGSSWALAAWYATGLPIHLFKDEIMDKMDNDIFPLTSQEIALVAEALMLKLAYGQPVTLVDVYGALLGNVLLSDFGDGRHRVYLSDQKKRVKHGEWPFPIYTAIRAEEDVEDGWYEFTPYEVGGAWVGQYVPTWAYGRHFAQGTSVDFAPEQSLGFHMGTFGSAFAARISEIYDTFKNQISSALLRKLIETMIVEQLGNKRLTYAEVFNFAYGTYKERFEDLPTIKLADGGSRPGFNLPYPVVGGERVERKADVMIFCDMSAHLQRGEQLRNAERYARNHNLKFPEIGAGDLEQDVCSIFKDENDPEVPVVIYMPLVNDAQLWHKFDEPGYAHFAPHVQNFNVNHCVEDGDCGTFDLLYEAQEANHLSKLTEFNFTVHKECIVDAIRFKVQQRAPEQVVA